MQPDNEPNKWAVRAEKLEKAGKDMQQTGAKIQKFGCALTLLFTLPIIGLLLFSFVGFFIGGILGLFILFGMVMPKQNKQ